MKKSIILFLLISVIFAQKQYFQQYVEYDIDVILDDSLHTLSAYEKLLYQNNSPDELDFIWFHIWPNAYKNNETAYAKQAFETGSTSFYFADENERGYIDSLDFKVAGKSVMWEFHPDWIDVVKVYLPKKLKPGASVLIETPFFVKLPKVFSRLGHTGKHYEITQWYPKPAVYDNDGWHPMPYLNMGEFYSEFGTFDVKITLPQKYRIMATGDLVNGDNEYAWLDSLANEGNKLHLLEEKSFQNALEEIAEDESEKPQKTKTLHFRQENVHDFAWFADPNWIVRKGELKFEESERSVTLWSMYLPKNAELWENSIEYLRDATYWYSKFYLEYPYNHVTAVDGDLSAGGGMEYPNITVISETPSKDLLEYVIMHEVGHNWFYGISGSNERDNAWMDEGLNEYSNIRYSEKKYNNLEKKFIISDFIQNKLKIADKFTMNWLYHLGYGIRALPGDDQPANLTSVDYERINYGVVLYYKTAIFTYLLQNYLGEEKMDAIMQEYFDKWKFKHPQPADFRQVFENNTDNDLSWYFDDVINDTKTVDYKIKNKKNSYLITNNGDLEAPFEIAYYDKNSTEISSEWIEGFSGTKRIEKPFGSAKAIIDPNEILPDINRLNNATRHSIGFDFVFDKPNYKKHNIYWVPWIFSGNEYNGWTPGVLFYNGYIPNYKYGISINPMIDFVNGSLVGNIRAKKTYFQKFGLRKFDINAEYSNYEGRNGATFSFEGVMRKPIISTPVTHLKATIYTHDIEREAVASKYYMAGKYVIGELGFQYKDELTPLLNYSIDANLMSSFCDDEFSIVNLIGNINWRNSKKSSTQVRGWLGHFLNDDFVPRQYRTYLSGGVDPNFTSNFALNREKVDDNFFPAIYNSQYLLDGPGLRGLAKGSGNSVEYSTETNWGVNLTQTFTNTPVEFFVDFAGATDLEDNFIDAGFTIDLDFLKILVPLYQNWDEESVVNNFEWIKDRLRFEFTFALNSIDI